MMSDTAELAKLYHFEKELKRISENQEKMLKEIHALAVSFAVLAENQKATKRKEQLDALKPAALGGVGGGALAALAQYAYHLFFPG